MISVVVPVFNEEACLPEFFDRLFRVTRERPEAYEFLFVDDGSTDRSVELLKSAAAEDPRVRVISLSRNFGHQAALSAGIDHAAGEAALILDADLQDPPEILPQLIAKWREGYEVVYAVRARREGNPLKRLAYRCFYRAVAFLSNVEIPADAGDFCLLDRKVIDVLRRDLPERLRFVRGLRAFAGFRQTGIRYERPARLAGRPKYTYRKLLGLALDGMFGFSLLPLRLATILGFLIAGPSFLVGLFFIVHRAFGFAVFGHRATDTPGLASLAVGVFFLGGIFLIILGILGEYVGRIYLEVKRRPTYIVSETLPAGRQAPKAATVRSLGGPP